MRKIIENLDKWGYQPRVILMCDCGCVAHQLIVTKDSDDRDPDFYIDFTDTIDYSLWGRIKQGLRWILHGPGFGTIIVDAKRLKELGKDLIEMAEEYEAKVKK